MSLFIEPGETTVTVAGDSVKIKVLSARDRLKLQRLGAQIADLVQGKGGDAQVTNETAVDIQEKNFEILEMCVLGQDPDLIDPIHWRELVGAIWKANVVDEEDAKN